MAPPKSDFEKQMLHLDAEIRRLEAEFNMFFAGRLPRPPWETRTRVTALVKRHDQSYINNTADRFRFETLQTRFYKFLELCDRQMTNREMGRPMPGMRRAVAPEPPKASPATTAPKAAPAGDQSIRVPTSADATERAQEVYQRLTEAKKAAGETPLAFDRVAALVEAQVEKYRRDGKELDFNIAVKDGKVSLTVKPVKDE